MEATFPKHCRQMDCPHYATWDMSIDDYISQCNLLKMQCDDCDCDFSFHRCPLTKNERDSFARIKPGDTVHHHPTNEDWVVCGVNNETCELIPCGYPFPSMANISDCRLIESIAITKEEKSKYDNALKKAGRESFIANVKYY